MKIELEISEENESTSYPWWFIVDPPGSGFATKAAILGAVMGPFFSRKEAQAALTTRRYDYGKNAIVWCASGYHSRSYRDAIDSAEKRKLKKSGTHGPAL